MSIRILDADEARTTILRRRAWDAWDVPASLLDGIERNFGARLTPDEAVRRILDDIRREGDAALRRWTETLDRVTPAALAVTPAQIADFARDRVTADGFGEHYMYLGLGHSIGLDVHESPWLRPGYDDPIRTNMCFTVEPKIWVPGVFYVRCEDVVVVGADRATPLTRFHYEPNIIE